MSPDVVRIMSFNIRGALSWDGINCWPLRRNLVAAVLRGHRPTVAAFQEVLWPASGFLAAELPEHGPVMGLPSGSRLLSARNPVFTSLRQLEVVAFGGFWLSTTPERWSRSWGARQVRSATWLRLAHNGRPFLLVNVHLDHVSERARLGAVSLIVERLRALGWPGIPVVLCGDFNCNPGEPVHRFLLSAGFRDTFLDAGLRDDDAAVTSHGFLGRRSGHDGRIDWILCSSPLRTIHAAIIRDAAPPRYPSDHYPVLADMEWS